MSSAKVITSEGAGDEMLNNDEIKCNNDNMILLSDACLLTLGSCSNSHEECIESFTEFCDSLLMNGFSTIPFMLVSSYALML
jgi:hypothetical protein